MKTMRTPKPKSVWGYYNFERLWGIRHTRRLAIEAVEEHLGRPWKEAREYMQVLKVIVTPTHPERK